MCSVSIEQDIIIENICENIITGKIEKWSSELLDSTQRYQLYKLIDKYDNLTKKTINVAGVVGKKIVIIEKISHKNITSNEITKEQVEFFIKYSKLPIPINLPENLEYYINLIKPYYDTDIFNYFIDDLNTIGYGQIKADISKVKNEIINSLKSNSEYKIFISNDNLNPCYPNNFMDKKSIYNLSNLEKNLISIDIRMANWTCYKKITKQELNINWVEFVSKFTKSKFISNSKYLREVIFGELNSKKLTKFIGEFLFDIDNTINDIPYLQSNLEKIMCSTDEIIYNIKDINNFNYEDFVSLLSKSNQNLNLIYRIEKFTLKQLCPYDYFIKEITNSNIKNISIKQIQFKQIPKHFISQSIKFYQSEELNNLDKKFLFENIVCTFDSALGFEKII